MEAYYKVNENLTFKINGENVKSILDQLTGIYQSVGAEECGKCGSGDTRPQSRKIKDDVFYEIRCQQCEAVLQLGVSKEDQSLYKKKMKTDTKGKAVKDNDGKGVYLPNGGWLKWNPQTQTME